MEDSEEVVYNLRRRFVRKRKYDHSDQNTSENDSSLELLPEIWKMIFNLLSVEDLKKVRLVSKRMSEAVLDNDKRFRTWTFHIGRSLPDKTDKVFQHDLKIVIHTSYERGMQNEEELICWLKKHSSHITGLSGSFTCLPQKVINLLSGLTQVKRLDLENYYYTNVTNGNAMKVLLPNLGPQLESLTVMGEYTMVNEIHLSSLKHLSLHSCDNEMISSILKVVPVTIDSLEIVVTEWKRSIEFPSDMKELSNLKTLKITHTGPNRVNLPAKFLSKSLTRLHLRNFDLRDLNLVDTDLPSLKVLQLDDCKIKMQFLKNVQSLVQLSVQITEIIDHEYLNFSLPALTNLELKGLQNINWLGHLLSACSRSLTTLKLHQIYVSSLGNLTYDLPVLTRLELNSMGGNHWLPQLISACSRSLTTLKLHYLSHCNFGGLACDLPVLKVLTVFGCEMNINQLVSKCSSSLQMLYLKYVTAKFTVNVPNLKELILQEAKVSGLTKLVSPKNSRLETIGLLCAYASTWKAIIGREHSNLKTVYVLHHDHLKIDAVRKSIITPGVQVITNKREWSRHLKDMYAVTSTYAC